MKSKSALRSELSSARQAMMVPEVIEKSQAILTAVQTILDKLTFTSLHCYEPIGKLREVDVSELLDIADKRVYTSRQSDGDWQIIRVDDEEAVEQPSIDVVIVPMLGFDAHLQRVGYGGGYYDQLLERYPKALKIGVCYEAGRLESVPAEAHDVPMDIIVTESAAVIAV